MPPRYIYQRRGGPLVQWNRLRPPGQSQAADTRALGSLGATDVFDKPRRLPRGGAPEYIADGLSGCGCGGKPQQAQGEYVVVGEYVGVGADDTSVVDKIPVRTIGSLSAVYHGYKRNESIGWALAWGVLGLASPLVTNVIAIAQGYGKKK